MVWPVTNWLPSMRMARSTPLRISGSPPLAMSLPIAELRPVSLLVLTSLPVISRPQVAALTNIDGDSPRCLRQSPLLILSAIRRSAVALSGMRSSASARHISATPSSDDSENSCISASTPEARVRFFAHRRHQRVGQRLRLLLRLGRAGIDLRQQPLDGGDLVAAIGAGHGGAQRRRIAQHFGLQGGEREGGSRGGGGWR